MLTEDTLFHTLTDTELWQRYCGFLDLSVEEFMTIQRDLLVDQLKRIYKSTLGKKILGGKQINTVDEFRRSVPLTSYEDYEPYLGERREQDLAEQPGVWCHSSGKGGRFKWVPYTDEFLDILCKHCITCFILCSSHNKGEINIRPGVRFLTILPPPPYASGCVYRSLADRFSFKSMPPQELSPDLQFQERVKIGFEMGLRDGIDVIASLASVLVSAGEGFSSRSQSVKISLSILHPRLLNRLLRAWIRSKRLRRPVLPLDLWSVKGIVAGGVDMNIYGDEVLRYWGAKPCEVYGATEPGIILALQSWNRKGLVFFPDNVFLEFIPSDKNQRLKPSYEDPHTPTVLFNELQKGHSYEVVVTQLYGMPLLRYRMRDVIKIVATEDQQAGIQLPHFVFEYRIGENINLGGLAEIDEKTMWKAIANTGIKYNDWTARKEYQQNKGFIHLYIEPYGQTSVEQIGDLLDNQLKLIDTDYKDIDFYLDFNPIKVTLLPLGTFQRYTQQRINEGADLAHLKPGHMNASDQAIQLLLNCRTVGE
jgi:hypothetical protein